MNRHRPEDVSAALDVTTADCVSTKRRSLAPACQRFSSLGLELAFASRPICPDFLRLRHRTDEASGRSSSGAACDSSEPIPAAKCSSFAPLCRDVATYFSGRRSRAAGGGRLPAPLVMCSSQRACFLTLLPLQTQVIRITVPQGKSEVDDAGGWRREGYRWGVWICGAERGSAGGDQMSSLRRTPLENGCSTATSSTTPSIRDPTAMAPQPI